MVHQEPETIRNECMYCLTNATFKASEAQIEFLVENGILNVFHETLLHSTVNIDIMDEILQALNSILNTGECHLVKEKNPYQEKLQMMEFKKVLENLEGHMSEKISKRAITISERFFGSSILFDV
jgi:hypothetical protein